MFTNYYNENDSLVKCFVCSKETLTKVVTQLIVKWTVTSVSLMFLDNKVAQMVLNYTLDLLEKFQGITIYKFLVIALSIPMTCIKAVTLVP